jgi:branched-chain amino acid transport system ATP-binding protein
MAEPLLVVEGLQKRFGAVDATRNLWLEVQPGEIHALIGPNGAGKTTAIAQLAGGLRPDAGRIRFAGHDVTRLPLHRRARLGLVRSFQITSVFERFSAEDNVALAIQAGAGHSFRFWRPARRDPRLRGPARDALERVGLLEQAEVPAASLSHGERRQLEVGLALACNPRLLLLDEPMAGLGPGGTRHMTDLIGRLKGGPAILLVEHDMQAVFALADRITVLVYGEAVATGTPEAIRADPVVRRAYLGGEGG